MRRCSRCGEDKDQTPYNFHRRKDHRRPGQWRWDSWCLECRRRDNAERAARKRRMREGVLILLQAHALTPDQLTRMLLADGPLPLKLGDVLAAHKRRGRILKVGERGGRSVYRRSHQCKHCPPGTPPKVRDEENFSPSKRDENGQVVAWCALCKPCAARKSLATYFANHEARKEQARKQYRQEMQDVERRNERRAYERVASQRRRQEKPEMERARQQRYRARVAADPTRSEERRDGLRIEHSMRLEREGRGRAFVIRDLIAEEGQPVVPSGPFLRWWSAYVAAEIPIDDGGRSRDVLALSMGTSDRSMRRIEEGEVADLDVVDRAFTRVGLDFVTVTGLTPADEDYPGGGTPLEIPGPHLLRSYYPSLYHFVRVDFPPGAGVEEQALLYLAADPTTYVRLAHKLGYDPQRMRTLIRGMQKAGRVEVVGEQRARTSTLPVYAPAG